MALSHSTTHAIDQQRLRNSSNHANNYYIYIPVSFVNFCCLNNRIGVYLLSGIALRLLIIPLKQPGFSINYFLLIKTLIPTIFLGQSAPVEDIIDPNLCAAPCRHTHTGARPWADCSALYTPTAVQCTHHTAVKPSHHTAVHSMHTLHCGRLHTTLQYTPCAYSTAVDYTPHCSTLHAHTPLQ